MQKNHFKIAFIFVATILGAGFVSGKELLSFFCKFNNNGILGFLISSVLLSLSLIAILGLIKEHNSKDYDTFLKDIFGKRFSKYIKILNILFLFTMFSTMLAGGGVSLSESLNIDIKISSIIFAIIVYFSSLFKEKSIIYINSILCPILIFLGAFIGIYIYFFKASPVFFIKENVIFSSIIYTSYNIITTISVLYGIKNLISNKKTILLSGLVSFFLIFSIGFFLVIGLIKNYNLVYIKDLPILYILNSEKNIKFLYSILIFMAIYTTAVSNAFALENTFNKYNKKYLKPKLIIFFIGIIASFLGFSNMVEKIYPIFGYLGLFQLIVIFIMFYFKKFIK